MFNYDILSLTGRQVSLALFTLTRRTRPVIDLRLESIYCTLGRIVKDGSVDLEGFATEAVKVSPWDGECCCRDEPDLFNAPLQEGGISMKRSVLSFLVLLILVLAVSACGGGGSDLTYKVVGTAAEAEVAYTNAQGETETETVTLPWETEFIEDQRNLVVER